MPHILKVAVAKPIRNIFDYLPPDGGGVEDLQPGVRLLVPFGRSSCVGYLLAVTTTSRFTKGQLKRAFTVLDEKPLLGPIDWRLLQWAARYYHHPVGEVMASAFPMQLRQGATTERATAVRLVLTAAGRSSDGVALKRAHRQHWLFCRLKSSENGISEVELSGLDWDWRRPSQALINQGLAELCVESRPGGDTVACTELEQAKPLNSDQQQAVERVVSALGTHQAFLLDGVTGSGKTEVYLQVVEQVLRQGKQAMVLLPEISLTPQLESRFRARIGTPLAILHSNLTDVARRDAWLAMQRNEAGILLGTRSAVFTPMSSPGVIIVDEEHDLSFKQQEGFRFSARDIAVIRAQKLDVPVLLGSATPSIESLANVERRRYRYLPLPKRAGGAMPPRFRILNIRGKLLSGGLSQELIESVNGALIKGEQALLFLNRRGYAPTLICHSCGWVAQCRRCDAHLVYHAREMRLRCHHCGSEQPGLSDCPSCGSDDLRPLGLGTERVEKALGELFPNARTVRIDKDSTCRKGSLEQALTDVREGQVDILLGTQMLAKGHHFPGVTVVGLIDVDAGLFSPDFRASERMAQLIIQVAGRAGREERPGTVLLQTRHPDHPMLMRLIDHGYSGFAKTTLSERKGAELPPFSFQALWRADSTDRDSADAFLRLVRERARPCREVLSMGPVAAPIARKAGRYRYQLLLQSTDRRSLHDLVSGLISGLDALPEARRVRWSVDVDPLDFS